MPNKLLIAWDKTVISINKLAIFCKSISSILLKPISLFIICCFIVSLLGTDKLKKFAIIKTAYYDTFVAFCPSLINFLSKPLGKNIVIIALVIIILIWILRKYYRQYALLIAHSTMGHDIATLESNFMKSFWIKRVIIATQLPTQGTLLDKIAQAIENQDNLFHNIIQKNWRVNIFYYGVAHTPLIFRLGYQFGQKCRIRYLHRFRPTDDSQEFREIPIHDSDKEAWTNKITNNNETSNELLVAISTTYPINDEDLRTINPDENMQLYKIDADKKGYDFFSSYRKIRSYADRITEDIRQIVKEKSIHTIHLAISSSVPFTFYLAQQMNTNQYPMIIVYHYNQLDKYSWGIKIQESDPTKAIVYTKHILQLKAED